MEGERAASRDFGIRDSTVWIEMKRDGTNLRPIRVLTSAFALLLSALTPAFAQTIPIEAGAGPGGAIVPSGTVMVRAGYDQTFAIIADSGYHILDVLVDSVSVGAVPSYTFYAVARPHSITASFERTVFTITASAGPGGTIDPSGDVQVNEGDDQAFTITPDRGYEIADVLVDGSSVGPVASYTFYGVSRAHGIEASFAPASGGVSYSDSADFTLDTTGFTIGGGVAHADSLDFTLDTTGFGVGGGVAHADSADFTLDTTGFGTGGGVAYSDSLDFTLDTTGFGAGGGVAFADSADFTLDTTGFGAGGGVAFADSSDFTVDTTGFGAGGGVAHADSADFTLDTTGFGAGGGVAIADSPDFTLDTTGFSPGGGVGYADSADFTLDTTADLTPFQLWQILWFGSTSNPDAAPDVDLFGNGLSNWFKFVAGLDPLDPDAMFHLVIDHVPGQANWKNLVFWPRWDDRTYTPWYCTNLVIGGWNNLTTYTVSDNGTERTVTDTNALEKVKFYSIKITYP
jgi:hypothetical protein